MRNTKCTKITVHLYNVTNKNQIFYLTIINKITIKEISHKII